MTLLVWRHPLPLGVAGRCIGRTDVRVDPRRAKRLAHRIRRYARRHVQPHVVWTSPLARGAEVGRWLRRWGWQHRVDERLSELDFGQWEGRAWSTISQVEVDTWCGAFAGHPAGGGECVEALMARCAAFLHEHRGETLCIVGHAGWINAARWVIRAKPAPHLASEWPAAMAYGAMAEFVG